MSDTTPSGWESPRQSPRKYRLQFRNRDGLQGRQAMVVCQNFRVTQDERLMYSDLNGNLNVIILWPGDYFDVKVMG
jgi:hypothetical protein